MGRKEAKPDYGKFYRVVSTRKVGGQIHQLVKFRMPKVGRDKRRRIIDSAFEKSGADAFVECFWTRGSIIYKNKWSFDAILIFDRSDLPKDKKV